MIRRKVIVEKAWQTLLEDDKRIRKENVFKKKRIKRFKAQFTEQELKLIRETLEIGEIDLRMELSTITFKEAMRYKFKTKGIKNGRNVVILCKL